MVNTVNENLTESYNIGCEILRQNFNTPDT